MREVVVRQPSQRTPSLSSKERAQAYRGRLARRLRVFDFDFDEPRGLLIRDAPDFLSRVLLGRGLGAVTFFDPPALAVVRSEAPAW